MSGKYFLIILMVILLAGQMMVSSSVFAQKQNEYSIEDLTDTVSINAADLRAEAEKLGIPENQTKRYVSEMRLLNKKYRHGLFTRTEYIAFKQRIIDRLK